MHGARLPPVELATLPIKMNNRHDYENDLRRIDDNRSHPDIDLEICSVAHRHGKTEEQINADLRRYDLPRSSTTSEDWGVHSSNGDNRLKDLAVVHFQSAPKTKHHPESPGVPEEQISPAKRPSLAITPPEDSVTLIPEGAYIAKCYDFQIGDAWGEPKLVLKFRISQGQFAGVLLDCFFNLDKKTGPDGQAGFTAGKRSFYYRLMQELFGDEGDDWLNPEKLLGSTFNIEVVTVSKDCKREDLGRAAYSKVKPKFEFYRKQN
jgi:hypothetical protein